VDQCRKLRLAKIGQGQLTLSRPDARRALRSRRTVALARPFARLQPLGDALEVAAGLDACGELLGEPVRLAGVTVAGLDQQPVLARFALAALHPHEHPAALHAFAVEREAQLAL